MKVAILMLSYERYDIMSNVLANNIANAGVPFDLFILDQGSTDERVIPELRRYTDRIVCVRENIGIAAGYNRLMGFAFQLGYTHFQFMANDILEPAGWVVRKAEIIDRITHSGMVSVAVEDHQNAPCNINGQWVYPGDVIGQFMLSRAAWEKVGVFREDFGKYGPVDNDYGVRCAKAGLINYYIPKLRAQHMDDHDNTLYGYDKADLIKQTWPIHVASVDDPVYHIPPGEYTMNAKEYV